MSRAKKIGIIFILVGICLPLSLLGFVSGYYPRLGLIGNILLMEIVLRPESQGDIFDQIQAPPEAPEPAPEFDPDAPMPAPKPGEIITDFKPVKEAPVKPKIAIPFKYIFALSVVLVFAGTVIIVLSSNKKTELKQ